MERDNPASGMDLLDITERIQTFQHRCDLMLCNLDVSREEIIDEKERQNSGG